VKLAAKTVARGPAGRYRQPHRCQGQGV